MPKGNLQIKRNEEIIRLREMYPCKQYTFNEIAKQLDLTRNQVAGVINRYYKGYDYLHA